MSNHKIQILPLRKPARTLRFNEDVLAPVTVAPGPTVKHTRVSRPKVRTGCQTCKIRRIKCDETKPACQRCLSTGRKCDGYPEPPPRKKANDDPALKLLMRRNPSPVQASAPEISALEFFYHKTGPQLSGYFDGSFWSGLVLQMSYADETIRHAMVAIGALAKMREYNISSKGYQSPPKVTVETRALSVTPLMKHDTTINDTFALVHYNKSIQALSTRINGSHLPIETALLSCLLFVCVEFLRGEVESAMQHFRGGMKMLEGFTAGTTRASTWSAAEAIQESMIPLLNRIELLAFTFGNDSPWQYPVLLSRCVPPWFPSLRACRDSLVHLMNLGMRFVRGMRLKKYAGAILPEDLAHRDALRSQLNAWKVAFDALLLSDATTAIDLDAAKPLLMFHVLCGIWLGVGLSPEETETDKFFAEFETAVSLAEAIQAFANSPEHRQRYPTTFAFDMKIISPMFYVCNKCRHPQIRRRALAVLQTAGQREGLWDSHMASTISEHIMRIEEKDLITLDGRELPKEEARIHTSNASTVMENGISKHVLTMFMKPNGPHGGWNVSRADLAVDPSLIVPDRKIPMRRN